jgi:hypothetical protein
MTEQYVLLAKRYKTVLVRKHQTMYNSIYYSFIKMIKKRLLEDLDIRFTAFEEFSNKIKKQNEFETHSYW